VGFLKACRCFALPYASFWGWHTDDLEKGVCRVFIGPNDVVEVFGYDRGNNFEVFYRFFIDRGVRKAFLQHLLESNRCRTRLGVSQETIKRLIDNS
jgi:hypothetical protein